MRVAAVDDGTDKVLAFGEYILSDGGDACRHDNLSQIRAVIECEIFKRPDAFVQGDMLNGRV